MTDAFQSYKEDFDQFIEDALRDISNMENSTDRSKRDRCATAALGSITEAERYLRILETESKNGDSQQRRKMGQQVRTFRSKVDKLRSKLERAKLMAESKTRGNTNQPMNGNNTGNMVQYQQRLDRTGQHLDNAQRTLADTNAVAGNITNNLQTQREHLVNVNANVDKAHEDIDEAAGHLSSLARKTFTNVLCLCIVIVGLLAGIIYAIVRKFQ